MSRVLALIILLSSLNAHAMFWYPTGRCPALLTSVDLEADQVAAVEPVFMATLLRMSADRSLVRWVLAGGSEGLKFNFIHAVLEKIMARDGLAGSVRWRELDDHLGRTLNLAPTTRNAQLARMTTMKLIHQDSNGRVSVDPTFVYRIGILSGTLRERGPSDAWLDGLKADERRWRRSKLAAESADTEIYWARLSIHFYRRILEVTQPEERSRMSRNSLLRTISKDNPFGLAVLKSAINGLVRAGALAQKPIQGSTWEYGLGFDSVLSVKAKQ